LLTRFVTTSLTSGPPSYYTGLNMSQTTSQSSIRNAVPAAIGSGEGHDPQRLSAGVPRSHSLSAKRPVALRRLRGVLLLMLLLALWAPRRAAAFCGFFVSGADASLYNSASHVVLLRNGNRTTLTMTNNYKGPPEDFALVVPVPVVLQKRDVKIVDPQILRHLDHVTAPRLVEYWEQDPCLAHGPYTGATTRVFNQLLSMAPGTSAESTERDLGVRIEAKFVAGEYEILVLSAKESSGLETWLRLNHYKLPSGAAQALAPYIREQMKFFVAKIDIKKVHRDAQGLVVLSPLRFEYDASELRLPVRLGLLNADGPQDLIVYILHPEERFEVANLTNFFIPTNLDVSDDVRSGFGAFYDSLFGEALRAEGGRAVATEYAWGSNSCDPCPEPPLADDDLRTLGAPQRTVTWNNHQPPPVPTTAFLDPPTQGTRTVYPRLVTTGSSYSFVQPYVITRLHVRYSKDTLSEDLLFHSAPPVIGGREPSGGAQGATVVGRGGGSSTFQGRYVIRHYWEGPAACSAPQYGRWGAGPGVKGQTQTASASAAGISARFELRRVVQSPVPSLGLAGHSHPLRPGETRR